MRQWRKNNLVRRNDYPFQHMSNINLVQANNQEKEFTSLLHQLRSSSTWQSSLYSPSALAYYRQRAEDDQWKSKNISFVLSLNNEPFFAFIGFLSTKNQIKKISAYELPSIFIESKNLSRSRKKSIQHHINSQLLQYECKIAVIDPMHNESLSIATDHLIQSRCCSVDLHYTRMIDLTQGESIVKGGLRKSFSSLINWGRREMKIELHTKKNISWKIIDNFKALHIKESGHQTRSDLTWLHQYESILEGEAFCITAKYNEGLVSAGYFTLASGHCYYAVSASQRALFDKPLFHAIMWEAILYAMSNGAVVFETGPEYPLHTHTLGSVTEKEMQIARFKSGFGGRLKPIINIGA